ncbi:MAG: helix-turn-helix transcriptional regulator [bacterium]|nr:helix-turn-helix transcriptional regulator [bacterium]
MDADLKTIGERLQKIRKQLGMLQKDFAKELGIASSSLCDIEAGNMKPRFELIYSITKKFKVNILYLLHGTGDMFIKEERNGEIFQKSEVFKQYREWLNDFLYYFDNSPMVRYAMQAYFSIYTTENDLLIKKDIEIEKKKRKEKKGVNDE